MNTPAALPTFRLERGAVLAQATLSGHAPTTLDSPASEVMTDLTQVKAATTHPGTTLRQAEQMMIYQGVRMLFVVTDMPVIEGLVTAADLRGNRQMTVGHERHLPYDELCVADVMTDLATLDAVDHRRLQAATVGDAVATLTRLGRNHLLVIEAVDGRPRGRVRGVISLAQIARQLGTSIEVVPVAHSFADIERALG